MLRSMALAILVATAGAAHAAEPFPGDRWRADVTEIRQGRILHTTIVGTETHTERGSKISVTCRTADGRTLRAAAYAGMAQDDFESGMKLGTFSIHHPYHELNWLGVSACARGAITWRKL